MGDKAAARRLAATLGVPVLPGYDDADQSDTALIAAAARIGFPLLVKPSAGGGGKGMRTVRDPDRLIDALAAARREALVAFSDDRLILERLVEGGRHIEIQVLFDSHGQGIHLGERDCSIQRRHQKVLEEAPSPAVNPALRDRLGAAALRLASAVGYVSAGTCEFIVDERDGPFFLEMNTRLQVEHPVTELVTGRDLVADQLAIAEGRPLVLGVAAPDGHAIEVRLYAEDAEDGFLPATGTIEALRWPIGDGIRVDAGITLGDVIGGRFDPMLAKIIAWGPDRPEALARLTKALDTTVVLGLVTNLRFLRWLVRQRVVRDGAGPDRHARPDLATGRLGARDGDPGRCLGARRGCPDRRRCGAPPPKPTHGREAGDSTVRRRCASMRKGLTGPSPWAVTRPLPGRPARTVPPMSESATPSTSTSPVGASRSGRAPAPDVDSAARAAAARHTTGTAAGPAELVAPMPGAIVTIHAAVGDRSMPATRSSPSRR